MPDVNTTGTCAGEKDVTISLNITMLKTCGLLFWITTQLNNHE